MAGRTEGERAPKRERARERPPRAPRTERVAVAMAAETRPAAWLRNFRLSGFALSVLLLIVAALVVLAPGLKNLVEQQQQIARLTQQVEDAEGAVDDLEQQVDRWADPAYIESQARGRLYYVFPGDVNYLVLGESGETVTADEQPISDEIQTTQVDWVTALLGSATTAGLTALSPDQLDSPVQLHSPTENTQ